MLLRSGNFWLFFLLGLNFWLVPLSPDVVFDDPFSDLLLGATLLLAIVLQGLAKPRFRKWAIVASIIIVAAIIVEEIFPEAKYVESSVFAVSFATVTILYFHTMTDSLEDVSFDTVLAAACTYILIGMFFAAIYSLVIEFDPTAFAPDGSVASRYLSLIHI